MNARLRQRWPVRSYARFKDKAAARAAMADASIGSFAELARRMSALYPRGLGPSRQYLSRLLSDAGEDTTSCKTADAFCITVGKTSEEARGVLFDFFVGTVRNDVARSGRQRRPLAS